MDISLASVLSLMGIIALGCYIQTNTGFAFALIVISVGTLTNTLNLPQLALVVSFLSLVNSTTALKGALRHVDKPLILKIFCGLAPALLIGIWLLNHLSAQHQDLLKLLLGCAILISALLLIIKPQKNLSVSRPSAIVISGVASGIMGGLFSTFGPPLAYLLYRQPIALKIILNTLLASFWVTAVLRLILVHAMSSVSTDIYWLAAVGAPWVVLCTFLSKRFPPPISEAHTRAIALSLLVLSGSMIIVSSIAQLSTS